MLRIRLARVGKKKQAQYRIVVADKRRAVQAKFVDILGWYNPHSKEISIKKDKAEEWLSKGAQPTNSLAILFKKEKIKLPNWVKIKKKKKKPKTKGEKEEKQEINQSVVNQPKVESVKQGAEKESKEEVEKVEENKESKKIEEKNPSTNAQNEEKEQKENKEKSEPKEDNKKR